MAFVAAAERADTEVGFFSFVAFLIGVGCVPIVLPDLWNRIFATRSALTSISVDPTMVTIRFPDQTKMVPLGDILKVAYNDEFVVVTTAEEEHVVRAHHVGQAQGIAQAIADAQARDEERQRLKAENGPTILDRPIGVPLREWLARLDATAAVALWATLDDPNREASSRAAAARLLARSPDTTVRGRVETTAKKIEDEAVRLRVVAALDPDADRAAEALEDIEAEEMKRVLSQD